MLYLEGQTALVTGGAQGIGKGIARELKSEGMRVVIADIDVEAGLETEDELGGSEGSVRFFHGDVCDEVSVTEAVRFCMASFGRLDVLINNAGIAAAETGPVEELSLDQWNRYIGVNLTGYFLFAKHAVPHLRLRGGNIINIASSRALQSESNTEAYAASKGGVVALTHALAISLGPAIRVNCISPGWIDAHLWKKSAVRSASQHRAIDHEQHPVGRIGSPEDIAAVAAFLISKHAGFITGQNFIVDGGMVCRMHYAD
jgi:NAD(P)-dependent dehydrogenase (short-subunit alcohol dehydrogenase family)